MSYGMFTENDMGIPIINEEYAGYTLFTTGTLRIDGKISGVGPYTKELNLDNYHQSALFAFRPPTSVPISYWGKRLYCDSVVNVTFAIFYPHHLVGMSNEKYGLRVFNSQGKLVFDSGNVALNTKKMNNIESNTLPSIVCDPGSWVMPTTQGVFSFIEAGNDMAISRGLAISKHSNGNFSSSDIEFSIVPGSLAGSTIPYAMELIEVESI